MNIQTKQPSTYAPTQADPLRLASATIQAVDRIGETTSEEIERTASEITRGAAQIAEKLQGLASAIREHSKIANEHVTQFCEKATSVFDGIRELQRKLEGDKGESSGSEIKDEVLQVPVFLQNGPTGFDQPCLKNDNANAAAPGIDFTFQRRP
jgi:hypothetical protein